MDFFLADGGFPLGHEAVKADWRSILHDIVEDPASFTTYSVRRAAAGTAEVRRGELPEVNSMGGWAEAPGSQKATQRKSAIRYAGDRDASAEASRIIQFRVIELVAATVAPEPVSWPRFRLAVAECDQDKVRRTVLRDLLSETCEAMSPKAWRLGAPEKKVLRLKVRALKASPTAAAHKADALPKRQAQQQQSNAIPSSAVPTVWKWALARGGATRVHISCGEPDFVFPMHACRGRDPGEWVWPMRNGGSSGSDCCIWPTILLQVLAAAVATSREEA